MNSRPFVSDLDDLRGDEDYLSESRSIIKHTCKTDWSCLGYTNLLINNKRGKILNLEEV